MAVRENGYGIRRVICEMVRRGHSLDDIQRRLSEETTETHLKYASTLMRVREELLAGKLKAAA